jgi:hypothetical protein
MNFSFKKFLPKAMKETRWGELIEVWQSIWEDLKRDEIRAIFNQYDFDNISVDELKELAQMFGYTVKNLTGYTSTEDFIKKEVLYLIPRVKTKTTQTCYQLMGIPFNLLSTGYSVIYDTALDKYVVDETLQGSSYYGTTTLDREDRGYAYLGSLVNMDEGIILDNSPLYYMDIFQKVSVGIYTTLDATTIDATNFPTLDGSTLLYTLTRNMVYNYIFKYIETATEFLSLNTLKVLKYDIDNFKKITDRCYYEPYLYIEVNSDHTTNTKTWTSYDGTITADQKSILIENSFADWTEIRFGTGSHTVINTSITDVDEYSFSWFYSGCTKIIEETDHYNFRTLITEFQKSVLTTDITPSGIQRITEFTELAIINSSGCALYSTFPKIQWDNKMYVNMKFDFQIV